jgi:glycosyltransferase involved in cell wall biosynthesis
LGLFAICAIFKDEAANIAEWLAFHLAVGFDHFVLYDNGSVDGARELVESLPVGRNVTIIDWPERPGQPSAYAHFFRNFRACFDWAAYIDLDEFIHPLEAENIREITALAGGHPAVLMNWLNFGPSGHETRPPGLVTENYLRRLPYESNVNRHVKSLIRCSEQVSPGGPHVAAMRGDPCNARGETIRNRALQETACHDGLVVNHYYTRSRAEWLAKVARGRAMVADEDKQRNADWFAFYEKKAIVEDRRILRWSARLRPWLQTGRLPSSLAVL